MSKKGQSMSLKPKTTGSQGSTPHKRPSDNNQQIAKSVRPQLPRDGSMGGINTTLTGKMPAGYMSVFNFAGNNNTKDSKTTKPGNAGGKKII
jgi:hypothetical protein